MLERKHINSAEIHELFVEISLELGFSEKEIKDYQENLLDLVSLWNTQKFVEIYAENKDRLFGRAKDSSLAYGASPYYIGIYHVRLDYQENDPLVVITFENEQQPEQTAVSIRFMIDHDTLFGTAAEKYVQQKMKAIRKRIDDFIQKGNQ